MSDESGCVHEKWREDFPIGKDADEQICRRDFIRFLTLVSGGLALGNASIWLKSLRPVEGTFDKLEVCKVTDLEPGSWTVFQYPDAKTPSILIRRESGEFVAFHQKCPHLACPVSYERSADGRGEQISCHCHNGKFDINNGQGVAGPPRELRPLRMVLLDIENDRVFATGLADFGGKS
ncbi:MAG: hypothetical protein A2X94_10365 [Bdellovibrionales bacterium GWB1_55_8]|nr:MAG: hypothetical protein A2X94_10365 [Bdellovibrionales bacterium GWB1_55_8]